MRAYAFRDSYVQPIIQKPLSHVVVGRIVDYAKLAFADERQVGGVICPERLLMFEQLHISISFTFANAMTRCCQEA